MSSRIEGLDAAARRLATAEAAIALGAEANDHVAAAVLGNIAAMESAMSLASTARRFELGDMLSVHRVLMDSSPHGSGRLLRLFAGSTNRACRDAAIYSDEIATVVAMWRDRLGRVRANSGTDLLLQVLPGAPIIAVESASWLIGRSKARTTVAVNALADADVLRQSNVGKQRYRGVRSRRILDLFTGLERALASPTGDTRSDVPVRHVPRRPAQS